MATSKDSKTPASGIQTLESGNRIIPSSRRADGSTRPERKVKPGFTPAEDVVKYQNRTAEAWRTRGTGGVPGATEVVGEKSGGGASSSSAGKKKRRRGGKKGGAAGAAGEEKDGEEEEVEGTETPEVEGAADSAAAPTPPVDAAAAASAKTAEEQQTAATDAEKKAKGLQKKIRQAQELKSRKERGETLLPEQLDKALRLGELIRDLEKLGIKYEG